MDSSPCIGTRDVYVLLSVSIYSHICSRPFLIIFPSGTGPGDDAQAQGLLQSFLQNNIIVDAKHSIAIAARVAAHFSQRCRNTMALLEMVAKHCVSVDEKIRDEKKEASRAFASACVRLMWHQKLSSPSALLLEHLFKFAKKDDLEMAMMKCSWSQKAAETALPTLMEGPLISSLVYVATCVLNPPQYGAAITALLYNLKKQDDAAAAPAARMLLLYVKCCLCGTEFPNDEHKLNSMDKHHARITVCAALFQENSYATLRRLLDLEAHMTLYVLKLPV